MIVLEILAAIVYIVVGLVIASEFYEQFFSRGTDDWLDKQDEIRAKYNQIHEPKV